MRTQKRIRALRHKPPANDGYVKLANAVIKAAADDYREAIRTLRQPRRVRPTQGEKEKLDAARFTMQEVEAFFHSQMYRNLTAVDGGYVIARIRKEEGYDPERISSSGWGSGAAGKGAESGNRKPENIGSKSA